MRITEVKPKDLHIVKSNLSWILEIYDKLYKSNFTDKFKRFMNYHDTNWNFNYLGARPKVPQPGQQDLGARPRVPQPGQQQSRPTMLTQEALERVIVTMAEQVDSIAATNNRTEEKVEQIITVAENLDVRQSKIERLAKEQTSRGIITK